MNNAPTEFKGIRCMSVALPRIPVDHPKYVWRGHADTDVQRTWKLYGWKPTNPESARSRISATAAAVRAMRKD